MTVMQRLEDLKWFSAARALTRLEAYWLIEKVEEHEKANVPKPLEEWHEDMGDCLWWFFPIEEPPYCGTPLDENFPDYVTHFTIFATPKLIEEMEG